MRTNPGFQDGNLVLRFCELSLRAGPVTVTFHKLSMPPFLKKEALAGLAQKARRRAELIINS